MGRRRVPTLKGGARRHIHWFRLWAPTTLAVTKSVHIARIIGSIRREALRYLIVLDEAPKMLQSCWETEDSRIAAIPTFGEPGHQYVRVLILG